MDIDIAFISTSSWSLRGLSTPNENKITVKRPIAKVSKKACLISDSSKYGKIATFHALDIEKIDLVLTDANLSDNATSDLQDKGVEVIRSDD